jgi:hypothetical protein
MATVKKSEVTNAAPKRGLGFPAGTRTEGALESGDLMPLDFMLAIVRDECLPVSIRLAAAKAALPYCHPKLASVQHSNNAGLCHDERVKALFYGDFGDAKRL